MDALLKIKGLRIEAAEENRSTVIIHDMNLELKQGEVLGLIGESGAGKSTIGLATLGYCRPGSRITAGSVKFKGIELTKISIAQKRALRGSHIAYVAQSAAAAFNPAYRLVKQFAEIPVARKKMTWRQAQKEAQTLYGQLLLPNPEKIGFRYPHQVSGGQLQRAMIAMAMSCKPDIIIFDEPTTALDVTTQLEVLVAIKEITRRYNTAAIYITHDLAVVVQLADRIIVMRNGKLVEQDRTDRLLKAPQQNYSRQLLSVRNYAKAIDRDSAPIATILETCNLSASYTKKGVLVIEDINLKVPTGKTVAVVGESGSGKTTLARVITGLVKPCQGSIDYMGKTLAPVLKQRSRKQLRNIQMVYQMPDVALNPRQKVKSILGRPLQFYFGMPVSARKNRIAELMDMVELPKALIDRYPNELSGGEKQRICIARALAARPHLIICDEVTSALDQLVAEGVLKLMERLQNELGVTYLFITHDLVTVRAIADEIVVMLAGRIVEQGRKEQVLSTPYCEYTQQLLSAVPEMRQDWLESRIRARNQSDLTTKV